MYTEDCQHVNIYTTLPCINNNMYKSIIYISYLSHNFTFCNIAKDRTNKNSSLQNLKPEGLYGRLLTNPKGVLCIFWPNLKKVMGERTFPNLMYYIQLTLTSVSLSASRNKI